MDKYVRGKVLGKGSFGSAVLVTNKIDGKNYVIKEIDISRMPKAERDASEQEAELLKKLKHPNIVRCLECFSHMNKLCIVMDWCSEGDLYGIMQKRRGAPLSEETLVDWFVQMCLGLKHVHDRKILHRDIKTQNVFMSAGGILKLGDFGVSKVLSSTCQLAATAVGTPYYLSPEICQNRKYNQKSDIWSLGCVMYELATGRHAFEAPNMRALIQKIIKGSYSPLPSSRSKELRDIIDRMLTLDWQKRPTINEILATPLLKQRIQKFLSATIQASEFSHTIIHGRPKPGQLVVGAAPPPLAPGSTPPVAAAIPTPTAAAPPASRVPSNVSPSPPPRLSGVGVNASPALYQPGAIAAAARPLSGANMGAPGGVGRPGAVSPLPGRAVPASGVGAVGGGGVSPLTPALAARQAQEAQKLREASAAEQREADARLKVQNEAEKAKARQIAAVGAQREIERLRLEEACRKLEQDKARMEADRMREKEKALSDMKRQKEADQRAEVEARLKREAELRQKRAEEELKRREAERLSREKEREDIRNRMAAQKKEWMDRQAAAERNKVSAEADRHGPVNVVMSRPAGPRKQWSPPRVDEAQAARAPSPEPRRNEPLTPEQRRAVWEEQRAAADRNRRQALEAERGGAKGGGGLAAFLGVPNNNAVAVEDAHRSPSPRPSPPKASGRTPPSSTELTDQQRRQAYFEMRAAAEQNRRQVEGHRTPPRNLSPSPANARPMSPLCSPRSASPLLPPMVSPGSSPHRAQNYGGARPVSPSPHPRPVSPSPIARPVSPSPLPRPTSPSPLYPPTRGTPPGGDMRSYYEAKAARLEEEKRQREEELRQFQAAHWKEMREARERNKEAVMREIGPIPGMHGAPARSDNNSYQRSPITQDNQRSPGMVSPRRGPSPSYPDNSNGYKAGGGGAGAQGHRPMSPSPRGGGGGGGGRPSASTGPDEDDLDYAAMVRDMQEVLLDEGNPKTPRSAEKGASASAGNSGNDDDDDDDYNDGQHRAALEGRFLLDGMPVRLPVPDSASLPARVEALRMYLEEKLGTVAFLKVYRRLESLSIDDDEAQVSREFLQILGQDKLGFLALVHQLIICEENMM